MISFPEDVDPSSTVYLNGNFVKLLDAKISPLDRGFLFADGVYEVVPVYNGSFFFFELHFDRLLKSLESIQLKIDFNKDDFLNIANHLVSKNKGVNQVIYLQITRGIAKRNHSFPKHSISPTIFAMSNPLIRPSLEERNDGVTAITTHDDRWNKCDIKSVSLLANVLAREEACKKGAAEAILIKDKKLHEGAASNIWVVKNNRVLIPLQGSNMLEGIRIKIIKIICEKLNLNFKRCDIYHDELIKSDEIFLTSATKEILAVTMVNGHKIGSNAHKKKPGPIFRKIQFEYDELIDSLAQKI
jgi:D-alanine transaminase